MSHPIIEFDRRVRQLVDEQGMSLDYAAVGMLMEIAVRSEQDQTTNVTDLVKCWRFGTGPTVHRHLENLVQLKLVCKVPSATDRRQSILKITNAGDALLKSLSTLMKKALK
jgi:DNA-binding MarR family transcriptional regulator